MDTHFDVLVLGTGLVQSIVAAALAKAGLKVAHIDTNAHYGGAEASLAQDELITWCESRRELDSISLSSTTPLPFNRTYALSLAPALLPSSGPLINALVQSGVARYTQFKLLDAVFINKTSENLASSTGVSSPSEASMASHTLHRVPATKEDIFRTRSISLVGKRKLMRFLQFAASDFHLRSDEERQPFGEYLSTRFAIDDEDMRSGILYALAFCTNETEPTLLALRRLQGYIKSAGRYGNSPFLIGHYGGLGELAQGFCRTCAVNGGIYILGRPIISLSFPSETLPASISLEDVPDVLTADIVLCDGSYLPTCEPSRQHDQVSPSRIACSISILNSPISFPPSELSSSTSATESGSSTNTSELRTAAIVISPSSSSTEQVIRLLHMGDETLSCPHGKYILYAWTPFPSSDTSLTPEVILHPHISRLIPASSIDFSCYYTRAEMSQSSLAPSHPRTIVVPSLPSSWSEIGDNAALEAERLFREIMRLKGEEDVEGIWPPLDSDDADEEAW